MNFVHKVSCECMMSMHGFLPVVLLKMLSISQTICTYNVEWMVGWEVCSEGSGLGLFWRIIPAFNWIDWGKLRKLIDFSTEPRIENLLNGSKKCYQAVVAWLEVLPYHSPGFIEENHEKFQSAWSVPRLHPQYKSETSFEPSLLGTCVPNLFGIFDVGKNGV
jgi:hypothetical protein